MTAFNYSEIQQVATDLIASFGRSVVFRKWNSTPPDPTKPWVGPVDPVANATTVSATAVFVPLGASSAQLGMEAVDQDLLKRVSQVALAAPGAAVTDDLSKFNDILDGNVSYKIEVARVLKPGDTTLLYFFGVSR